LLETQGKISYAPLPEKGLLITSPTFGRPDFPAYCVHCYFANHAPLNKNGSPMFVYEPPSDPGHEPWGIIIEKKDICAEEG
jgi:hypothetical protein